MPKGWYEKIDQVLSQQCFAASVAKQHSSTTPVAFHTPTPTRNTPSRDPNAMDIDSKEKPRKLTPEEREKCFKEGHCIRCRQKGVTIYFSLFLFQPASLDLTVTLSPCHLTTSPPLHLISSLPYHLVIPPSRPRPRLVLVSSPISEYP